MCLCGGTIKRTFAEVDELLYAKAFYDGYFDSEGKQTKKGGRTDTLLEHRVVMHFSRKYLKQSELCSSCKISANRLIMTSKEDDLSMVAISFINKRIEKEISIQ